MPLGRVQLKSIQNKESSRIEPGSVVEYEHNGKPVLAIVLEEKKGKWSLLSEHGRESELPATRLYLFPGKAPTNSGERLSFLKRLEEETATIVQQVDLKAVWETVLGELAEVSIKEITELALGEDSLQNRLATKRKLLTDKLYFKRKKITYEPRTLEIVEELQRKLEAEEEKERLQNELVDAIAKRIGGNMVNLPEPIALIEDLAVFGPDSPQAKEAQTLLERVAERTKKDLPGDLQDKAFHLLVACKHFTEDENLSVLRYGRTKTFSEEVLNAARNVQLKKTLPRTDLRSLFTLTIDSPSTQDVDDALSLEELPGGYRIGIHIANAASLIEPQSILDDVALYRGTSIYCPDLYLPMLPKNLSEDFFSLHQGQDRGSLSFFVSFNEAFEIVKREIVPSLINVKRRFSYDEVDTILSHEPTDQTQKILHNLSRICETLEQHRLDNGAFQFSRRQPYPTICEDGVIRLEDQGEDSSSHRLVGELMILANETGGLYAKEHGFPLIFRTQEAPDVNLFEQGLEIEDGIAREYFRRSFLKRSINTVQPLKHFGLALGVYAQLTSPIRRAIDLINQRQLQSFLFDQRPFYSHDTLSGLISSLEVSLAEAQSIQRERERYFLLKFLVQGGIRELGATVIKTDLARPLAELDTLYILQTFLPPGYKNDRRVKTTKRPGDRVLLKVDKIDPRRDVILLSEVQ